MATANGVLQSVPIAVVRVRRVHGDSSGEQFPRERVFPYAFRHTFAQRHADNGTPIDVLATMMGHRTIDTTRGYYKVNKSRMRQAVARVSEMQLNHRGHRVSAQNAGLRLHYHS